MSSLTSSSEHTQSVAGSDRPAPLGPSESELRLQLAVEAAGVGIFDYDIVRETLVWDPRTREMFGIGPDDPVTYEGTFLTGVHPDDRERTDKAVREALDPARPDLFDCEYRTIDRRSRALRWIAARGQLVIENGVPVRLVGTVRDITADRAAQDAIRASRERYRLVTRATNDAIWDWDLVADHVLWNEALSTAYGWEPQQVEPTGAWWLAQVHPDDRAYVEDDIRTAITGSGTEWNHEYRFRRADGRYADVLDRGSIVRGPDGASVRMIGAMLDLTERNRAEAQLRAVFEGANVGIVQLDPHNLTALRVNAKLCAIWGAREDEIVGHSVAKWTPEEDAEARDVLHRRLVAGEIMRETLEKRYRRKDGRLIWARVNLVAQVRAGEMQTTAMIEDITAEKFGEASQTSLIALADRLLEVASPDEAGSAAAASLGRALGTAHAGYAAIDPSTKRIRVTQAWAAAGTVNSVVAHPLDALAETVARLREGDVLVVPDAETDAVLPREAMSEPAMRALVAVPLIRRAELVGWLFAGDGAARDWMPREVDFAEAVAERTLTALARIDADEQQRILNRELSHRLKNTLAMVQAIVSQTLRNVADIDDAKEVLVARLIALGKAHDVLLEGESESADITAVIAGALAIHDDDQPGRFRIEGPPILVGPTAALALTLMIHELATNAVKYGALSVPGGYVVFGWSVEPANGDPKVRLRWTEQGGPPVAAPSRKGFGSRLIERGFTGAVGGRTAVEYAPGGLVCRISAPLSGLLARE